MKRVEGEFEVRLPPVRLYLDDIEDLWGKFIEFKNIRIEHKDFEYDSVDELKAHVSRKTISELKITAISALDKVGFLGYMSVNISPNDVTIYANKNCGDKPAAIAEYLRKKTHWYSWVPASREVTAFVQGFTGVALLSAVFVTVNEITPGPIVIRGLALLAAELLAFYFILPDRVWAGGSRIKLYRAASETSFWERNGERIVVLAISSLMTGVIGFLLGRISK